MREVEKVDGKGINIADEDLVKVAEPFGFSKKKVLEISEQTADALNNYPKYAQKFGLK